MTKNISDQTNYSLYTLKAICAFLVVCLHAPIPLISGIFLTPISRIAVPLFYIITGYYLYNNDQIQMKKKLIDLLTKSVKILITVNLFYLISRLAIHLFHEDFSIIEKLNIYNLCYVAFLGKHLWYITSLIYSSIIFLFLINFHNYNKIFVYVCFISLFISIIIQRNDLSLSISYLTLGFIMKNNKTKLLHALKINSKILYIIPIFIILMCIESFLIFRLTGNNHIINSIVTPLFVSALFLSCLKYDNIKTFASIGKIHSANIYFYHWAFIYVINTCISKTFFLVNPFVVFVISLLFSVFITKYKSQIL